ncbi:MAG: hypothetical protein AAF950_07035, partial [Pseudomonadota bacterium]
LFEIAQVLKKSPGWFYDNLGYPKFDTDDPKDMDEFHRCLELLSRLRGTSRMPVIREVLEYASYSLDQ